MKRRFAVFREKTELIILGSTGSVGRQTLDVVRSFPELFKVVALSTHRNIALLEQQISEFRPFRVAVTDADYALPISIRSDVISWSGSDGLTNLCATDYGDVVVNALVGMAGVEPTLFALSRGKDVVLANKETIVSAGALVMREAKKHNTRIIPIDSEHSALYQCIHGEHPKTIERLILTASGGPFRTWTRERIEQATVEEALAHPTWRMGQKITIDSATMMNKGFEVIEAMHLFGVPLNKIEIVVHPESIVHSLVEFVDHSIKAQLSLPDMRLPIQYAISRGARLKNDLEPLRLENLKTLSFEPVRLSKFPCLGLALEAAQKGGTFPAALTAANDYMVEKFLKREIQLWEIAAGIEYVLGMHQSVDNYTLSDVLLVRTWAENMLDTRYGS